MALVSEYAFTTGADSSGNGYTLTIVGTPSVAGGHTGNGAIASPTNRFEGKPGANSSLTSWTFMAWVKVNSLTPSYQTILGDGVVLYSGINSNGSMDCYPGTGPATSAAGVVTVGTWVHYAAVNNAGSLQIYVNGVASGSAATGAALNFGGANTYEVGSYGTGTEPIDGIIDDLRIFDTALTAGQITTWMNTPAGASAAPVPVRPLAVPPMPFGTPWRGPTQEPFQLQGDQTTPAGNANISVDDTGTGTDAVTVAATASLADTAAGADTVTVTATATIADTAAGTDALTVTVAASTADTGTGTDGVTIAAAVTLPDDPASGADAISVLGSTDPNQALPDAFPVPFVGPYFGPPPEPFQLLGDTSTASSVTLADVGTGSDTVGVAAAMSLADTATGTDVLSVTVTAALADTGAGADAVSVAAAAPLDDTGTGADSITVQTGIDQNQAWPSVAWMFLSPNESSFQLSGSQATAGDQVIGLPDTAAGTDSITVTVAVPLADTAAGADAVAVTATTTLADTGTGTDAVSAAAAVPLADTGSVADTVTVTATVPLDDTGAGTDAVGVLVAGQADPNQASPAVLPMRFVVPWLGPTVEPFQLSGDASSGQSVTMADTATGTDSFSVVVSVAVADTGSAADTLTTAAAVPLADTGSGVDGISVSGSANPSLPDTASAVDTLGVTATITISDTGTGADALTVARAAFLNDTITAADGFTVVVSLALPDTAGIADGFTGPVSDRTITIGRATLGSGRHAGTGMNTARRAGRGTP